MEKLPLKLVIIDETIVMFGMEDPVAGATQLTSGGGRAPARSRTC